MMTPFEFIVCVLATWQACEIWRHGSIFEEVRESIVGRFKGFIGTLLGCLFCLSPWVSLVMVIQTTDYLYVVSTYRESDVPLWHETLAIVLSMFRYALAVARCAQLGNDLTYSLCRTPKSKNRLLPSSTEFPS